MYKSTREIGGCGPKHMGLSCEIGERNEREKPRSGVTNEHGT